MQKILIADTSEVLSRAISRQLQEEFLVLSCSSGAQVLNLLPDFDPDILVINTILPEVDCITVLKTLRLSGRKTQVLALSRVVQEYVYDQLESLGVCAIMALPCAVEQLVSHIRSIGFVLRYPNRDVCSTGEHLEEMLLSMGFRMVRSNFQRLYWAVMEKYIHPEYTITKELYPAVISHCGGNIPQTEKALRDTIRVAYERGNADIWRMYFPDCRERAPTNDTFISTMARCLQRWENKEGFAPCVCLKAE